jgi:hypothetical protein
MSKVYLVVVINDDGIEISAHTTWEKAEKSAANEVMALINDDDSQDAIAIRALYGEGDMEGVIAQWNWSANERDGIGEILIYDRDVE